MYFASISATDTAAQDEYEEKHIVSMVKYGVQSIILWDGLTKSTQKWFNKNKVVFHEREGSS